MKIDAKWRAKKFSIIGMQTELLDIFLERRFMDNEIIHSFGKDFMYRVFRLSSILAEEKLGMRAVSP